VSILEAYEMHLKCIRTAFNKQSRYIRTRYWIQFILQSNQSRTSNRNGFYSDHDVIELNDVKLDVKCKMVATMF